MINWSSACVQMCVNTMPGGKDISSVFTETIAIGHQSGKNYKTISKKLWFFTGVNVWADLMQGQTEKSKKTNKQNKTPLWASSVLKFMKTIAWTSTVFGCQEKRKCLLSERIWKHNWVQEIVQSKKDRWCLSGKLLSWFSGIFLFYFFYKSMSQTNDILVCHRAYFCFNSKQQSNHNRKRQIEVMWSIIALKMFSSFD